MSEQRANITELLNRASAGDLEARNEVYAATYRELEDAARALRSALPSVRTLQTVDVVSEAYLRITRREPDEWDSRRQFFFYAVRAMRDFLVEEARLRMTRKRRGEHVSLEMVACGLPTLESPSEFLALHSAIDDLEAHDPVGSEVVMLRYFAGLKVSEVAKLMGLSVSSVERKWRFARVWLLSRMTDQVDVP